MGAFFWGKRREIIGETVGASTPFFSLSDFLPSPVSAKPAGRSSKEADTHPMGGAVFESTPNCAASSRLALLPFEARITPR